MAADVEAVVNQALVDIGYPGRVMDINEGSEASIAALEVYGQTRDELLVSGEWPLARRANVPLTLLKGPPPEGGYNPLQPWSPQYPPPGWLYEYAYPADMLNLLSLRRVLQSFPSLDPRPVVKRVDDDNSLVDRAGAAAAQQKVILANIPDAVATYVGQVTSPPLWGPAFTALVVKRLGEKLARRLRLGEAVARDAAQQGAVTDTRAAAVKGA